MKRGLLTADELNALMRWQTNASGQRVTPLERELGLLAGMVEKLNDTLVASMSAAQHNDVKIKDAEFTEAEPSRRDFDDDIPF